MEIVVKSTTKESRQAQGKQYWGVKHEDGQWYNLITDSKPAMGARYKVEVKETQFQGRTYRWANIVQQTQHFADSNGRAAKITSDEGGRAFDFWSSKVNELSEWTPEAKASVLCTLMIATFDGKVASPKDDEIPPDAPALDGDDIPW